MWMINTIKKTLCHFWPTVKHVPNSDIWKTWPTAVMGYLDRYKVVQSSKYFIDIHQTCWYGQRYIRPWQYNCLVPVTRPTLAQNGLNRRLSTFLRAPAKKWNHGDSWNEIVRSWWRYSGAIFSKRRHVMQACMDSILDTGSSYICNSNLSERSKCSISFIKTCLVFFSFGRVWFSDLPITWLYRPSDWHVTWQAGANGEWLLSWHNYRDFIIIMTSFILPSPRWWIHKTIAWSAKIHPTFAINLHILWFDFSKTINLY